MEAKYYIPVCSEVFPRSGRSVLSDRYTLYCSKCVCKLARMSCTLQSFHFRLCCLAYLSPFSVHPQMKQKGGLNKWKRCKRKPNVRKQVVSVTCPWHQHLNDVCISSTSLYNASFSCTFTFSDSLSILLSFPLTLQIFLWMDCVCERIRNKLTNEWQQWRRDLCLQAGLLS